jgi:ribosomal protein S14
MISSKYKDIKYRKKFLLKEKNNTLIKFLFTNQLNEKKNSKIFTKKILYLNNIKKNSFKTKKVNRCILNNRSRGSIRNFGINRILLRDLFQFGIIPGYKKAVW